jgi:hypothetical protein
MLIPQMDPGIGLLFQHQNRCDVFQKLLKEEELLEGENRQHQRERGRERDWTESETTGRQKMLRCEEGCPKKEN